MKVYLFPSKSNPSARPHRTTLHDNGATSCTCPARVLCWHRKRVLDSPPVGREEFVLSRETKRMVQRLVDEGNEKGAVEALLEVFPSMSEGEVSDLLATEFPYLEEDW